MKEPCSKENESHIFHKLSAEARCDRARTSWLVPASDRGGDVSPSRDGWRLLEIDGDSAACAGGLGAEASSKNGHFGDHRL
jgi:hypothetical protein